MYQRVQEMKQKHAEHEKKHALQGDKIWFLQVSINALNDLFPERTLFPSTPVWQILQDKHLKKLDLCRMIKNKFWISSRAVKLALDRTEMPKAGNQVAHAADPHFTGDAVVQYKGQLGECDALIELNTLVFPSCSDYLKLLCQWQPLTGSD
ncbi:hypothetical protein BC835DRAFT_1307675 [Cytidiella melzeri]|nr:hypothetical protein BC835DRAFT_1307675 [Cytidiella melzeri]